MKTFKIDLWYEVKNGTIMTNNFFNPNLIYFI